MRAGRSLRSERRPFMVSYVTRPRGANVTWVTQRLAGTVKGDFVDLRRSHGRLRASADSQTTSRRAAHASCLAVVVLAGSLGWARAAAPIAPLLDGMGPDRGPVASRIPLAQRYFHQGMVLTWGFNPAEAARSFAAATAVDPRCALCYWGLAWASGPNINADMTADDAARVRDALARAPPLAAAAPRRDRALIEALSVRHPVAGDAAAIDEDAYADRMRELARKHPRDADMATLAAEAKLEPAPLRLVGAGRRRPAVDRRRFARCWRGRWRSRPSTPARTTTGST